jgi:hypothetical protein
MQSATTAGRRDGRRLSLHTGVRGLTAALARAVGRAGARHFEDDDAFALRHGWTITIQRGGLARSYRDPRFDALVACLICAGACVSTEEACSRCGAPSPVGVSELDLVEVRTRT